MTWSALRFHHPDEGLGTAGFAVDAAGRLATLDPAASVRQALVLLLTTRPGERVMRPGYGTNLFRLVFEPNDDTTAGLAIHYARASIRRWEPRVEVIDIDAEPAEDPAHLRVRVDYRIRTTLDVDVLIIDVPVGGGQ